MREKNRFCHVVARLVLLLLILGAVGAEDRSKPDSSAAAAATGAEQPVGKTPILVVTDRDNPGNPFGGYLVEILRGEGLVEFNQADRSCFKRTPGFADRLASYHAVVLAEMELDAAEEDLLRQWVRGGGLLIAMRPDADLADVFGVKTEGKRAERLLQYFAVAPELPDDLPAGMGIVAASLQYHGQATDYALAGARPLAFLYQDVQTPSASPAVTLHLFGKGRAVAYAFDLAKSIVLMRQGNPEWRNSEGDGIPEYRPMDMFLRLDGRKHFDPDRLKIPQADEAQRLLANLILSLSPGPLPRMWYLPKTHKTLVVNTGDAEDMYGAQLDPVLDECAKYGGCFSVYLRHGDPGRGIERTRPEKAAAWRAAGHEVGVHVWAGGREGQDAFDDLDKAYGKIVGDLKKKFGHVSRTARNHTIDWTGWVDMAAIMARHGTRMDMNYYHYLPPALDPDAYGYFTGTGLPQRFIDAEGRILPIYQATTQWSDEWFADNDLTVQQAVEIVKRMLEAAENGYYSAFVNNIHPVRHAKGDRITPHWPAVLWRHLQDKGIPSWSGEMLLDFVEARNAARFENLAWQVDPERAESQLKFAFRAPLAGQDLTVMIPAEWSGRKLRSVLADGKAVEVKTERIKGITYGMFTTRQARADVVARYAGS